MTRDQIRYCGAIMRNLKKHRDATPFLHRVDYVKMNIPDYPKVIKHPMDLSTVDRKLNNYEYDKVEDFVADIRLVFSNCYKYNGPEAMISMLCQNVESAFEKSLRQMPPSKERSSKMLSPPPIRRTSGISEDGRPKREIHPPPSKDYPEPMTKRRNPRKNDQQMKFCMQTLRELKKSKYRDINYPFLAPVDIVALNIPDYPSIVKHPMDLSTIERKLNEGDYTTPEEFEADMRLMFNNCYLYNPPAIPVHKMGKELEKVFDDKWAQKPQPSPPETEQDIVDELEELEESDEDDRDHRIAELERHIATISQQIASIKTAKRKKPERSTSKAVAKRPSVSKEKKLARPVGEKRRRPTKRKDDELPEFTFEQKKDLSEQINNLAGDRLNTVVSIIQSSMPNLDGVRQEEIVLDIDALDRKTLHRLHEFVTGESLVPQHHHKKTVKRPRTHYSEADADRKIRELEKTLQKFNSGSEPRGYYGKWWNDWP
ncbi:Bromodomain-containing protein [Radiomyces spectabilis]|uniref:Bromodomain-containing protein n=1 Tax=Radiomyces spectabilis TaxID=64574 RepID=UPI002220324C|nr:Bromodomain-containing protein [Radiomyces spectabilis]KAI8388339.1 Bromodomain-containing protein [Radiomyces spectabilis]